MLTDEQTDIIRHSLGLTQSKKPYRNHYCANISDSRLEPLAEAGLMERGSVINEGRLRYYHVTQAGAQAVGLSCRFTTERENELVLVYIPLPMSFTDRTGAHPASSPVAGGFHAGDSSELTLPRRRRVIYETA